MSGHRLMVGGGVENRGRLQSPASRKPWSPVPAYLRYLVYFFIALTVFDMVPIPGIEGLGAAAKPFGFILLAVFIFSRGTNIHVYGKDVPWFVAFIVIGIMEEGYRWVSLPTRLAFESFYQFLTYLQVMIMFFIIRDVTQDPRAFRGVLYLFIGLFVPAAVLTAFFPAMALFYSASERIGVVGMNVNSSAFVYTIVSVCLFSWLIRRWPKLGFRGFSAVIALFFLIAAIALTGSRTGAICLGFGMTIALVANAGKKQFSAYLLLVPLVVGIGLQVVLKTDILMYRFTKTIDEHEVGIRDELARIGLYLIAQKPIVGYGPTYSNHVGRLGNYPHRVAVHNTYLQFLLTFGIIGSIPFVVGCGYLMRAAWDNRESQWGAMAVSILGMTAMFSFGGHLGTDKTFWMILGLAGNVPLMAELDRRRTLLFRPMPKLSHGPPVRPGEIAQSVGRFQTPAGYSGAERSSGDR